LSVVFIEGVNRVPENFRFPIFDLLIFGFDR